MQTLTAVLPRTTLKRPPSIKPPGEKQTDTVKVGRTERAAARSAAIRGSGGRVVVPPTWARD